MPYVLYMATGIQETHLNVQVGMFILSGVSRRSYNRVLARFAGENSTRA